MKSRIVFIFSIFVLVCLGLIVRAVHLQLFTDSRLSRLKERQYSKKLTVKSHRGEILDRDGRELAVSVMTHSLFADPQILKNRSHVAKKVSRFLKLPLPEVSKKMGRLNRRFVWIKRHLSEKQKREILSWKIRGLSFIEESKRFYPRGGLLKPVLGFVGSEGQGLEGLEFQYDSILKGKRRELRVQRDARGRTLVVDPQDFFQKQDGADLFLTVDSELQYFLEKELRKSVWEHEAESAMGIVLEAQTSEILAMASIEGRAEKSRYRNRAVTDFFEPGSTVKTIVAAGALREGVAQPNTVYDCENGSFQVGGRVIREASREHKFGFLTLSEILARSSNVGITKVAFELGSERVKSAIEDFGFSRKSGVDLPGEVSGLLHPLPWRDHQLSNISFGHAMTVTALQVANAYAAIANGGVLNKPYIVKKVTRPLGVAEEVQGQSIRRVLSPDEAHQMKLMLMGVASEGGTARKARVPGFLVAGKTGTAQKVNPEGRGYLKGAYISSFAGFIPVQKPKYVIYIQVDNPQKHYYGSTVAAPVFSKVAAFAMRRSGRTPLFLSPSHLTYEKKNWWPESGSGRKELQKRALSALRSPSSSKRVPDFRGLSLREVYRRSEQQGIRVEVRGKGRVLNTSPRPGEVWKTPKSLQVFLSEST